MYKLEDQQSLDIDWFATDPKGMVVYFASGGGRIPNTVASHPKENKMLTKYFRGLPVVNDKVVINPNLKDYVSFPNSTAKEQYLADFIMMAQRGFFSFDKTNLGDFSNDSYHLVAIPQNPITCHNFPLNIMDIVTMTKVKNPILGTSSISIEADLE